MLHSSVWMRDGETAICPVHRVVFGFCAVAKVATVELLQTLAANTAAPFILCSRLASVPGPSFSSAWLSSNLA